MRPTASLDAAAVVEDVCTRLDGLPLAIELAAARVRVIPVQQLADRLDDRFRLLTGGARTALPRQQTLRAVVEWSYDLLFDDERRVFELLSVFAGGCSLEAAEAVCAGDQIEAEDVADLLAHLVDKSLVVADHTGGQARFHLLQTLALFGRERLAASKAANEARDRHAAHYLALAERGTAAFRGEDQAAWLEEIAPESDNLRGALAWFIDQQDAEAAHRLVGGMGWMWWMGGNGEEGLRWFDSALSCTGSVDPRTRAHVLAWACGVGTNTGQGVDLAISRGEEAVALLRDVEPDDRLSLADACQLLAIAHMRPAQHERSLRALRRGRRAVRRARRRVEPSGGGLRSRAGGRHPRRSAGGPRAPPGVDGALRGDRRGVGGGQRRLRHRAGGRGSVVTWTRRWPSPSGPCCPPAVSTCSWRRSSSARAWGTCCCARATSRARMPSTRRRWPSPSRWARGSATA